VNLEQARIGAAATLGRETEAAMGEEKIPTRQSLHTWRKRFEAEGMPGRAAGAPRRLVRADPVVAAMCSTR
jgi:hypothetical protein